MEEKKRVQVWDLFVRVFHWTLVATFAISYFSTSGFPDWVHNWSGYAALALIAARVVWGFTGSKHARFADFVAGPRHLLQYVSAMFKRAEPRYLGHNPAAALMILFLMAMVTGIGVTGWMLTLDAYWGSETVEDIHVLLVDITLIALVLHIGAAIYESWNHRENLVWSMVVGTKREATDDPDRPKIGAAAGETAAAAHGASASRRGAPVTGAGTSE